MSIDWVSQPLAALSALVIGFIWYGVLFQNEWMKASGMTEEKIKKGLHPGILYGISLLLAFVITIGLKFMIIDIHKAFESTSEYPFFHGMNHGFFISFLFGAIPVLITNSMFDQRNWKYILINSGYWILTFSVMGGIIGAMG